MLLLPVRARPVRGKLESLVIVVDDDVGDVVLEVDEVVDDADDADDVVDDEVGVGSDASLNASAGSVGATRRVASST